MLVLAQVSEVVPADVGGAVNSVVVLAAITAFCLALLGFAKSLVNREWNAVKTTLCWWAAGILGLWVFAQSGFAPNVELLGVKLVEASIFDIIIVGVSPGSFGIVLNQGIKAIDNTQSAAQPPLFPSNVSPGQGTDVPAPPLLAPSGESLPATHPEIEDELDADAAVAAGLFTDAPAA